MILWASHHQLAVRARECPEESAGDDIGGAARPGCRVGKLHVAQPGSGRVVGERSDSGQRQLPRLELWMQGSYDRR